MRRSPNKTSHFIGRQLKMKVLLTFVFYRFVNSCFEHLILTTYIRVPISHCSRRVKPQFSMIINLPPESWVSSVSYCFKQLQRTSNLKSTAVKTKKKVTHRLKENLSLSILHDPFEKIRLLVNMSSVLPIISFFPEVNCYLTGFGAGL